MAWLSPPRAEALALALSDRGEPPPMPVTYLDPVALGAQDDTVARQLRALSARGMTALVIAPSELAHAHRTSLERLPDDRHQLICTCRHDAAAEVIEEFRAHHPRVLFTAVASPLTPPLSPREPITDPALTLELVVKRPRDLRELRLRLSRMLDAAGFDAPRRDRSVLAVHEATLVASGYAPAPKQGPTDGVQVHARLDPGGFVVDIGARHRTSLSATRAQDPLHVPRAFCDRGLRVPGTLGAQVRLDQ